jgi:uncharacterized protein
VKGSAARVPGRRLDALLAGEPTDAERETLYRLALWTDDPDAERAAMARIVDDTNARSRRFCATVVLTLACNLACPYCFEGDFRDGSEMPGPVARLLVDTIVRERIARGRDVEIRFYGGEPLVALPLLTRIATALQAAARAAGTRFSFGLVTNGTLLTRARVEALLPLGLSFAQVTLDGPAAIHDRQRPFADGRGSHAAVLANVAEVHDLVTLKLGGNYRLADYREFPRVLDDLLAAGVDPARLDPVQFAPVMPRSGRAPRHGDAACAIPSDEPEFVEASLFLREETLRRGFPVDKVSMGVCTVELDDRIVVDRDGALYKCPAFMGWPEMAVGTLADGVRDHQESHRPGFWRNDACLDCRYLPLCFGGCRLLPLLRTGKVDGPDCRKAFFETALERLVLQQLRHR